MGRATLSCPRDQGGLTLKSVPTRPLHPRLCIMFNIKKGVTSAYNDCLASSSSSSILFQLTVSPWSDPVRQTGGSDQTQSQLYLPEDVLLYLRWPSPGTVHGARPWRSRHTDNSSGRHAAEPARGAGWRRNRDIIDLPGPRGRSISPRQSWHLFSRGRCEEAGVGVGQWSQWSNTECKVSPYPGPY